MAILGLAYDQPFVGVIDVVAEADGKLALVNFGTFGPAYEVHEVILFDRLTAYRSAEPDIESKRPCVLVKSKDPKIERHLRSAPIFRKRREIASERFYERSKWCSYCEYCPYAQAIRREPERLWSDHISFKASA